MDRVCGTESELCCFHRALLRRPNRRVVSKKVGIRMRNSSHHTADVAFHPQLSMAHGERTCLCVRVCMLAVWSEFRVTWHGKLT